MFDEDQEEISQYFLRLLLFVTEHRWTLSLKFLQLFHIGFIVGKTSFFLLGSKEGFGLKSALFNVVLKMSEYVLPICYLTKTVSDKNIYKKRFKRSLLVKFKGAKCMN